ncbi:MAG: EAL domain-containing protein, partial [Actinomycetota bacterium]|nr:EAL domain-containing protein [Actinomycetota bacterium]
HVAAAAGRWVMKSAPAQYFAARERSQTLGLNVSPLELCGRGFCRQLEAASEVASDAGGNLILEVLEGHPIDPDDLLQLARVARKLDILLALDDYGVGFSTSEHRDLGVFDVVKIDRSFVPNTPRQMEEFARVAREIRAAKAVPLAEGIETAEEAEHVREAGVTLAQGYFFGRPGPLPAVSVGYMTGSRSYIAAVPDVQGAQGDDEEWELVRGEAHPRTLGPRSHTEERMLAREASGQFEEPA